MFEPLVGLSGVGDGLGGGVAGQLGQMREPAGGELSVDVTGDRGGADGVGVGGPASSSPVRSTWP
jgi:hypothetical protein